ncbi:MAG: hypothetical protein WC641_06125 [Patescibacteria group bacterium]
MDNSKDLKSVWSRVKIYLPALNPTLAEDVKALYAFAKKNDLAVLKVYDELQGILRERRAKARLKLDESDGTERPPEENTEPVSQPTTQPPTPPATEVAKPAKQRKRKTDKRASGKAFSNVSREDMLAFRIGLLRARCAGQEAFRAEQDRIVTLLGLSGSSARSTVTTLLAFAGHKVQRANFIAEAIRGLTQVMRGVLVEELAEAFKMTKRALLAEAKTSPEWQS